MRKSLYGQIEKQLGPGKKVIAFFTSFSWPVIISDFDADMIEEVLQNSDFDGKELVLILNSPGGEALSAERIVNICRSYANGLFSVIVPKMAKSAATMICFGAKKIGMGETSELGPVDPQIPIRDERGQVISYRAAHEIIESYQELVRKANQTKGRLEPYLQQLARFDARDIRGIISAQALSESISVKCLKTGMLARLSEAEIKAKMKPFLDPTQTQVHGRPIYPALAKECGLKVEVHDLRSQLWKSVWALYVRLNFLVTHSVSKVIESASDLYTAAPPPRT